MYIFEFMWCHNNKDCFFVCKTKKITRRLWILLWSAPLLSYDKVFNNYICWVSDKPWWTRGNIWRILSQVRITVFFWLNYFCRITYLLCNIKVIKISCRARLFVWNYRRNCWAMPDFFREDSTKKGWKQFQPFSEYLSNNRLWSYKFKFIWMNRTSPFTTFSFPVIRSPVLARWISGFAMFFIAFGGCFFCRFCYSRSYVICWIRGMRMEYIGRDEKQWSNWQE